MVSGAGSGSLSAQFAALQGLLQGEPVGIHVGWLGVLKADTLLGAASVVLTYLIVLIQFAQPPAVGPSSPTLNTTTPVG